MSPKPRHGHHPASDGSGRILIDRYGCESQDVLNRSSTPSKPQASSCKMYSKNILLSILSIVTHIFVDYMKRNTLLKIYLSAIPLREVYFLFVPQDSISTLPLCAPPPKSSASFITCSLALVSSFVQPALERTISEMKKEEDGMSSLLTPPLPHCCGLAMVLCQKPHFLSGSSLQTWLSPGYEVSSPFASSVLGMAMALYCWSP